MSQDIVKWVDPIVLTKGSEEQIVGEWSEKGFALLDGVFSEDLIDKASRELINEVGADASLKAKKDFGGIVFPFPHGSALNTITIHEALIDIVSKMLKTGDIRLTQADAWAKFYSESTSSKFDNRDQRMHIDGWNHTLVAPSSWYTPASVAMILYLSDSADTGGETALVAREGPDDDAYQLDSFLKTPGAAQFPWINDKTLAEAYFQEHYPEVYSFRRNLYARERRARFRKGTLLLYRHDLWHRGTPLTVPNSVRLTVNFSFRRGDAQWIHNWNTWAREMYQPDQRLEKLVGGATVKQRALLGVPLPGDKYWTEETLACVNKRYAMFGFDAEPYLCGMTDKTHQN